jgi:hypothetical protein
LLESGYELIIEWLAPQMLCIRRPALKEGNKRERECADD